CPPPSPLPAPAPATLAPPSDNHAGTRTATRRRRAAAPSLVPFPAASTRVLEPPANYAALRPAAPAISPSGAPAVENLLLLPAPGKKPDAAPPPLPSIRHPPAYHPPAYWPHSGATARAAGIALSHLSVTKSGRPTGAESPTTLPPLPLPPVAGNHREKQKVEPAPFVPPP